MQLLSGIKILDASHVIAGPFASYQLALMGAEVIRVERIDGDDFVRTHGGTESMRSEGLGASFVSQNSGKKCIQINLKDARGVALFKQLATTVDVMIENFRPGVMDRLGLGYDAICAEKADIIYCSLNGYGPDGPLRDSPAYDHIVQGVSGMMSMTGTEESGPLRVGLPITDYITGTHAALAISAALHRRAANGIGAHLHISMLGSVLSGLGAYAVDYQTTGRERGLEGNRPFSGSPFAGSFPTSDGFLVITANTVPQAERLVAALGDSALQPFVARMAAGEVFDDTALREAETALGNALRADTAENWERKLAEISVPAGKVRTVGEILAHPQTEALGTLDTVPVPSLGHDVQVPGLGFSVTDVEKTARPAPERIGQSTVPVLEGLGIAADELDALAQAGVIAGEGLPDRD